MGHRLIEVEQAERYGALLAAEIAAMLPVMPPQPSYAYRFTCTCTAVGIWTVSRESAIDNWFEHMGLPEVVREEDERDEIVRLVDQLGGLDWIRGMASINEQIMPNTTTSCPDCGRHEGHEPECSKWTPAP